ncbi:hypothetical protein LRS37_12960 [Neobacillus sedimentimangrovi]|uniref:Uncharacterized protein n=1 Tax=Neobacillus sedimentimangrovi TaxID=2699460 RepID=A0ABS8QKJ4_9BACI|nr:hypothetical protein [Neobacillus sedimentimangrovi]MCD4839760.1 hypothetical protein [Neobacillus sedimentimangrovi]
MTIKGTGQITLTDLNDAIVSGNPPANPTVETIWLDTSTTPNTFRRWDGTEWVKASVTTTEDIGAYPDQEGKNLNDIITEIDNRTQTNAIVRTVIDSEDFDSILSKKADTDSLTGLASIEYVESIKQDTTDYVDDKLYGEEGIVESINKVKSDLEKTNNDLVAKFKATGGVNLIYNSVGFAGTDFWAVSGTMNTEYTPELESLGFGSGFVTKEGQSGYAEQEFNTISEENTYTLSFYMKKTKDNTTNGYAGIDLYINNQKVLFLGLASGAGTTNGNWVRYSYTFSTEYAKAKIRVTFGANAVATITGIMVNKGDTALDWSMAHGEVYNTAIQMNLNGIKVISNAYKGYTIMSPEEFSGYAEVLDETTNQPVMAKVFTLNQDTTEVTKIQIDKELNMSPIKIVPIVSTSNNGWAFIPTE